MENFPCQGILSALHGTQVNWLVCFILSLAYNSACEVRLLQMADTPTIIHMV